MLALIPNNGSLEPKVLNLKEMLKYYLAHQEDVVTRRTKYDLNKAERTCSYPGRPAEGAG